MKILKNIPVEFEIETLLLNARIKPESQDGKYLSEFIERFRPKINPKAIYKISYIQNRQEKTVEIDDVCFTSRILSINLEKTERVFPFVATAGIELEEFCQKHNDMLHYYCLDMLKETVLRKAFEYLQTHLRNTYMLGDISIMNPGSLADWPVTEQKPLFSLFGDVKKLIGVELTESCLMYPVKSLSGFIFTTETTFVNCQLCPRENCPSRKAPYDEALLRTKYHE